MKILYISLFFIFFSSFNTFGQTKKDGTPDMRYKQNKQFNGASYSSPSYSQPRQDRNYTNGGNVKIQNGYLKSNGTYVEPHFKTTPDNNKRNNLSNYHR